MTETLLTTCERDVSSEQLIFVVLEAEAHCVPVPPIITLSSLSFDGLVSRLAFFCCEVARFS